jgi:hypothetical protein
MTARRDPDQLIRAFLDEGWNELPDRAYDAVRADIEGTRQRVVIGPWKEQHIMNAARFALAAAAVVLVAVVGIRFVPGLINSGPGATLQPTQAASQTPIASTDVTPTVAPSPIAIHDGRLTPGTYLFEPFAESGGPLTATVDVPSSSWEGMEVGVGKAGESDGLGMGFLQVLNLNGDPCAWKGAADDVAMGPTVDDLVAGLGNETEYDTSDPVDVTLGGYAGKRLVVTMPGNIHDANGLGCSDAEYRIWDGPGFAIYAQGPNNRWTMSILDVDGQRVVVMMSDFADSDPALSAELESMVNSVVINP